MLQEGAPVDPTNHILYHATVVTNVDMGLQALTFSKSNKLFPTYALMQKVWNKARQMKEVIGFTRFSPIWGNGHYSELKSLQYGAKRKLYGITHHF